MFGDERASAKEISLFFCVFNVRAQRFPRQRNWRRMCECAQSPHLRLFISRNYWVSIHTSNFSTVCQSDPEIRRLGARAHVQRCHTPLLTCGKHLLSDPQPTYQIWTQSVEPFLRYRSAVCTCARAEIPHPWHVISTKFMIPNSHTKIELNRPSRLWDTEARCARAHVQRYPIRDYCICCN